MVADLKKTLLVGIIVVLCKSSFKGGKIFNKKDQFY